MSFQLSPLALFVLETHGALTIKTGVILTHLTDMKIVHRGGAFVATPSPAQNLSTLAKPGGTIGLLARAVPFEHSRKNETMYDG